MSCYRSQKLKMLLASKISEDTIIISGREVTVSQESFIKADIKAARSILENLRQTECYTTQVIKVIES